MGDISEKDPIEWVSKGGTEENPNPKKKKKKKTLREIYLEKLAKEDPNSK